MQIIQSPKLVENLKGKYLFLDTNALIGLINFPELFGSFISNLKSSGCALITIPQVQYEFTRGSSTYNAYLDKVKFLHKDLELTVYHIDKYIEDYPELVFLVHKVSGKASYTDYLLGLCLCKFQNSYLMTSDNTDISINLFDREYIITVDTDKDLMTYGFYKRSEEKMERLALKLLQDKC